MMTDRFPSSVSVIKWLEKPTIIYQTWPAEGERDIPNCETIAHLSMKLQLRGCKHNLSHSEEQVNK